MRQVNHYQTPYSYIRNVPCCFEIVRLLNQRNVLQMLPTISIEMILQLFTQRGLHLKLQSFLSQNFMATSNICIKVTNENRLICRPPRCRNCLNTPVYTNFCCHHKKRQIYLIVRIAILNSMMYQWQINCFYQ